MTQKIMQRKELPVGVGSGELLEEFRAEIIPAADEYVSDEEIDRRAEVAVAMGHISAVLLGELVDYVVNRDRVREEQRVDELIGQLAYRWGCKKSTLYRNWAYTSKHPSVPRPKDLPRGMTGEALQMAETEDEANELLDTMVGEDWGARELREMRRLENWGVMPEGLCLVQLGTNDRGMLYAQAKGQRVIIGELDQREGNWLKRAGKKLLKYRIRGGVG